MTIELIKSEFRAWLETKHSYETVGQAGTSTDCPIATYLYERTGKRHDMHQDHYKGSLEDKINYTPLWVYSFIHLVDEDYDANDCEVTAKQAIHLLSKLQS